MIPKIGEAVLIGNQKETERASIFDEKTITIGGDRSYSHDVWVCVAVEPDRCVIMKLVPKGYKPSDFWDFGITRPQMIEFDQYPINKCSEQTLEAMTGYTFYDDLLAIVKLQKLQKEVN